MTTPIQSAKGIPPHDYTAHLDKTLERARLADIQARADAYQRGAYAAYVAGQRKAKRRRGFLIALLIVAIIYAANRINT